MKCASQSSKSTTAILHFVPSKLNDEPCFEQPIGMSCSGKMDDADGECPIKCQIAHVHFSSSPACPPLPGVYYITSYPFHIKDKRKTHLIFTGRLFHFFFLSLSLFLSHTLFSAKNINRCSLVYFSAHRLPGRDERIPRSLSVPLL